MEETGGEAGTRGPEWAKHWGRASVAGTSDHAGGELSAGTDFMVSRLGLEPRTLFRRDPSACDSSYG